MKCFYLHTPSKIESNLKSSAVWLINYYILLIRSYVCKDESHLVYHKVLIKVNLMLAKAQYNWNDWWHEASIYFILLQTVFPLQFNISNGLEVLVMNTKIRIIFSNPPFPLSQEYPCRIRWIAEIAISKDFVLNIHSFTSSGRRQLDCPTPIQGC